MEAIKEYIRKRFDYCNAIAKDIVKHNASLGVLRHARNFATIESPLTGETDACWIRVDFSDIYIFIHMDEDAYCLCGETKLAGRNWYQLDPECAYGAELINVDSETDFWKELDQYDCNELERHYGAYCEVDDLPRGHYVEYTDTGNNTAQFDIEVTTKVTVTVDAESADKAIEKACELAWQLDPDEQSTVVAAVRL